jgi:hypothetical protein
LLAQAEQRRCSLPVAAAVLLQVIHRVVSLVVVVRWALATQGQASPATGRCPVQVAPLRLVVLQRQRLSRGNSLEVVQVLLCLVRDFKVVADAAHQRKTLKAAAEAVAVSSVAAADVINAT